MSTRIRDLIERYEADGDVEAATGLRREVRRHRFMLAGRMASWIAFPLALAIALADLVQLRILADGFAWDVGHLDEAQHHWLWGPLALFSIAAGAYRRACRDD